MSKIFGADLKVRVTNDQLGALRQMAAARNLAMSDIVREAIDMLVRRRRKPAATVRRAA